MDALRPPRSIPNTDGKRVAVAGRRASKLELPRGEAVNLSHLAIISSLQASLFYFVLLEVVVHRDLGRLLSGIVHVCSSLIVGIACQRCFKLPKLSDLTCG